MMTKKFAQVARGWLIATAAFTVCGSIAASAQPARQSGEGFEFRRKLAVIANPYCAITTYVLTDFPEQASSTNDAAKRPVIVIDASTFKSNRPYALFLMAHECCHHILGHIQTATAQVKPLGPQPFYYLRPQLKTMELEADACAVRTLKRVREFDAIDSARSKMLEFGTSETGAYYPTGVERADNIALIAPRGKAIDEHVELSRALAPTTAELTVACFDTQTDCAGPGALSCCEPQSRRRSRYSYLRREPLLSSFESDPASLSRTLGSPKGDAPLPICPPN